jgi:hypothetical protein
MTRRWIIGLCVALAACATQQGTGTGADAGAAWTANILAQGASGHGGSANAVPMDGGTHVTVFLTGGAAGGVHPWHVHEGVCDSNGPVVGSGGAYPALRPDAAGNATADAHLDVALDPGGSYYINIHQSASDLGTIVGCGELVSG